MRLAQKLFDIKLPTLQRLITCFIHLGCNKRYEFYVEMRNDDLSMEKVSWREKTFSNFQVARYAVNVIFSLSIVQREVSLTLMYKNMGNRKGKAAK